MDAAKKNQSAEKIKKPVKTGRVILTTVLSIISIIYVSPIFIVLMNSFKRKTDISAEPFSLPNSESWVELENYVRGMVSGNYPFYKSVLISLFITVASVFVILLFTSMTAWYLMRVNSVICKIIYYFCIFQ